MLPFSFPHYLALGLAVGLGLIPGCSEEIDWQDYPRSGRQAVQEGRFEEAEVLLLQSLEEAKQWGNSDPRLAATMHELGDLYLRQGKFPQSESYLWQSLPAWVESLGAEHPALARSLTSIALSYYAQGKFDRAKPLFKRALAIREKALGRDHPEIVEGLQEYETLLRQIGQSAEADSLEKRRIRISNRNP